MSSSTTSVSPQPSPETSDRKRSSVVAHSLARFRALAQLRGLSPQQSSGLSALCRQRLSPVIKRTSYYLPTESVEAKTMTCLHCVGELRLFHSEHRSSMADDLYRIDLPDIAVQSDAPHRYQAETRHDRTAHQALAIPHHVAPQQ